MKRIIIAAILLTGILPARAQSDQPDEIITPVYNNPFVKAGNLQRDALPRLNKAGITDTLELPFFDDFSSLGVLPDESKWTDRTVFINADFAVNPPTLGVATFDGLNSLGNPHREMNSSSFGPMDTLTSQPIDLSQLTLADNIYLSFLYEPQGRSFELLNATDSLVLQFKNGFGAWVNVWSAKGDTGLHFRTAIVQVADLLYLHETFQFRWINFQPSLGNLKHWHLDYVYLDSGRHAGDTLFEDQGVALLPQFPFKTYTYMPWKQLQQNPAKYLRTDYQIDVGNLSGNGVTIDLSLNLNDPDGAVGLGQLIAQPLAPLAVQGFPISPAVNLPTPNRDTTVLVIQAALGNVPGSNVRTFNDTATRVVELSNFFAYDDGTAESGYGLRNGSGSVALGFELETGDSIRGIKIHFTQAEAKVVNGIAINVWRKIAPVDQPSIGVDELVYSKEVGTPKYTDTLNGFHFYELDSAIYLEPGLFYVGWTQNTSFMVNVGLDRNFRLAGQEVRNPNLFYNVNGVWKQTTVLGTPMIRPVVGDRWPDPATVGMVEKTELRIYPNPAGAKVRIESGLPIRGVFLYDLQGRSLELIPDETGTIDLSSIPSGLYLLRIQLANGHVLTNRLNIQH